MGVGQGVSPDLWADGQEQLIEVAGFQRLRLRLFDPSRDTLTEHVQTDARLLAMFGQLDAPEFDTEEVRAFYRLFAGCVRGPGHHVREDIHAGLAGVGGGVP